MSWSVDWRVAIDGRDASSAMRPLLTTIDVVDRDGTVSDSARLTFDDRGGQCLLPDVGAQVAIDLEGARVFEGVVDSTPWTFTRGAGRLLSVNAKGFDTRGRAKQGQRWHLDDAPLSAALGKAAETAGFSGVVVDPAFGSIVRDYWSPDGASFLAWGQRLARQFGATFKVRGTQAVFARRGAGLNAGGQAMPTVHATIPGRVIAVNIDPSRGRRRFSRARVRSFDRESASFLVEDIEFEPVNRLDVSNERREMATDPDEARALAEGRRADSDREAGGGTIELDLTVEARAEGTVVLSGARPGIDGIYRIAGVTHRATRSSGATTVLDVKQPQGEAGRDARGSGMSP